MIKRIFDIIFSLIMILCLWPLFLIVAVIITFESPGDPIYKARRVGENSKIFTLYKFRSMRLESGPVRITTLQNDSRIFHFGKILRKTKLDETLQVFNIFKADMSVVGFRPEDEINADEIFKNEYLEILSHKPGLTSPASLFDYTHGELIESEEEYKSKFLPIKLEMELYYVQNQTLWYDLKLIFRTIKIIIQKSFGKKNFPLPPEYSEVMNRLEKKRYLPSKEKIIT